MPEARDPYEEYREHVRAEEEHARRHGHARPTAPVVAERDRQVVDKERKRKRRRKVARDGAERGSATGPILGILAGLAVQYGLPEDTASYLTEPATIAAVVAVLGWLARIAEALIADGRDRDTID